MPDDTEAVSDIGLTPRGLLRVEPVPPPSPWPDPEAAVRASKAFSESTARGLLHLATKELNTVLPPAAVWWREFARLYLTRLCHTPELEQAREIAAIAPPVETELAAMVETAPPMRGGEYLGSEILGGIWIGLDERIRADIRGHALGAADWLKECHPLWRMIGRVSFHLAENKKNAAHPFAFMASYASRLSSQSRVQHLPLGRAVQEYAGAQNKRALINLLAPIHRAGEKSEWIRGLVESNHIFKALPWTPAEAHRFLKDVPAIEEAGILVRLPDWWKGGRPPRPRVQARVGSNPSAGLGAEAMLDFSVEATLDGEPLTEEEWRALIESTDGLALVRGKWVEVDSQKLREALAHWKKVEKLSRQEGLTFFDGMRLLAGFQADGSTTEGTAAPEAEIEWSGIQAGPWLEEILAELRHPARAAGPDAIAGLRAQLRPHQAAHVIHFDRWWNPAVENQATDRAFRIGQVKNVLVHKFVCRGTIEERIDQVIEDKKSLSTELIEGGGERQLTEMNNDELLRFVALDLGRATAS